MNKKYLLSILILLISLISFSQNKKTDYYKKLESRKISFITEELQLTPEEAQQFWPLYNEYRKKEKALRRKMRKVKKLHRQIDKLSEQELAKHADDFIEFHYQRSLLAKKYHKKFMKILSPKKVLKFYFLEGKFKRRLFNRVKNHHKYRRKH